MTPECQAAIQCCVRIHVDGDHVTLINDIDWSCLCNDLCMVDSLCMWLAF